MSKAKYPFYQPTCFRLAFGLLTFSIIAKLQTAFAITSKTKKKKNTIFFIKIPNNTEKMLTEILIVDGHLQLSL